MGFDRRNFIKTAGVGIAATGLTAWMHRADAAPIGERLVPPLNRVGPKEVVDGRQAVVSSQSPIVTQVMLDVLAAGGNAVDATVAGSIVQATVQPEMTNHTGTVSWLYWDAKQRKTYQLNSMGTLHPSLPPFRPYPPGVGGVAAGSPMACIPGFMPGMAAMHERFGTMPWNTLVKPAIPYAEDGFPIDEFQHTVMTWELEGNVWFPEMRALFAPGGFVPSAGEKLKNPELAKTLHALAEEGPEYFTKGAWAREFVSLANKLGWKIELKDMSSNPPRWTEPLRYGHKGYEIVQTAPPERQGLYCCLVLGILRHLDISRLGHYTQSAESLYFMAQALRRAHFELGHLHDPEFFGVPSDVWMSEDYIASIAKIFRNSMPKPSTDLTKHVELTTHPGNLQAFGWAVGGPEEKLKQPSGSCELTCVDKDGNWVQMMNTLQSGGIPGMVVGGVPMVGSHAAFQMDASIAGWLGLPGSRMRSVMSNTIVMKGGEPVLSLGSPGNVHCTVPQMLSNNLDYDYTPYQAAVLPRMLPIHEDYTIEIEARIPTSTLRDLARLGAKLKPLPPYDFHMGSFQQAWRDSGTGLLGASTDPRRGGQAGGI